VFGWTPDILEEWSAEVRPLFGDDGNPAACGSSVLLRVRWVGYQLECLAIKSTEMLPETAASAFSPRAEKLNPM
jgi:hypothetical protein